MTQKRISAPSIAGIERKRHKYLTSLSPGPHPKGNAVSLLYMIRDVLKIADNAREAKKIISGGMVKVDGKIRKDRGFPIGMMDILKIGEKEYRVTIDRHGFVLENLAKEHSEKKLLKITGKSKVKNGKFQIHFHDGKNMLTDKNDYKTGDVAVWNLRNKQIDDVMMLQKGAEILIIKGKNRGTKGKVTAINARKSMLRSSTAIIKSDKGQKEVPLDYIFVTGGSEQKEQGD